MEHVSLVMMFETSKHVPKTKRRCCVFKNFTIILTHSPQPSQDKKQAGPLDKDTLNNTYAFLFTTFHQLHHKYGYKRYPHSNLIKTTKT